MSETAIAFAGAKWVFLAQFSDAEVMVVSMVAVQGHAVVLSVSKSPRCRASCAKKFALRGLMVDVSAKKFALHAQNTPKSAFLRLLGEFFAETRLEGPCWASYFAPIGPAHRSCGRRGARGWLRWGFCSIRSWLAACRTSNDAISPVWWRPGRAERRKRAERVRQPRQLDIRSAAAV